MAKDLSGAFQWAANIARYPYAGMRENDLAHAILAETGAEMKDISKENRDQGREKMNKIAAAVIGVPYAAFQEVRDIIVSRVGVKIPGLD